MVLEHDGQSGVRGWVWSAVAAAALCGAIAGCGSGGASGTGGGGGTGGASPSNSNSASLIPTAPVCQLGQMVITGTIDGSAIHDEPDPISYFEATQIDAGSGANGTYALDIGTTSEFVRGMKTPIATGFYYIGVAHPLMGQYLCLTAGEIGPVADASKLISGAPPKDVLLQFHVSAGKVGAKAFDCSGADVPVALDGCIDLDSARFLP